MSDGLDSFGKTARGLARNPLGIIALFIVLVYGIAAIFVGFTSNLEIIERLPLIYFLVLFPVLVLGVFAWLVSRHAGKLYAPGDFENEENYLAAIRSVVSLATAPLKQEVEAGPMAAGAADEIGHAEAATSPADLSEIANTVRLVATSAAATQTSDRKRILWVDDEPASISYVRQAFEGVGIAVELALSTAEALDILKYRTFSAIISDMGRKEGPREGYVLLDAIRERGLSIPFFVYSSSNLPEHKREVRDHGGQGSTNSPRELFEMVAKAILRSG
jgi:CheY-like chemotaxis protein